MVMRFSLQKTMCMLILMSLFVFVPLTAAQDESDGMIHVNQNGYYPDGAKVAVVADVGSEPLAWQLRDAADQVVAQGMTTVFGRDSAARAIVHHIDFSEFETVGEGYYLTVGELVSFPFDIRPDIYRQLKTEALRYFYLNRSGIALEAQYAGEWARPAGHLSDEAVTCFDGEDVGGTVWEGCDYVLDVSKGWYDAGDYGKYVVNGGIAVWTMQNQYERNTAAFADGSLNIPESGNGIPDILDEARWQMEFMLGMQVPDGGELGGMVHHKVHDLQWHPLPFLPPTSQNNDNEHRLADQGRYVYAPSTAATLNLAATAAQCARIWAEIDTPFSQRCLAAAERAWQAAQQFPEQYAGAVPGNGGGNYPDEAVRDEFYWAAAELFVTTGKDEYRQFVLSSSQFQAVPQATAAMYWGDTAALGTITLALVPNDLTPAEIDGAREGIVEAADWYIAVLEREGYRMPILHFDWGSNSAILNNMLIMGLAYELTEDVRYLHGMTDSMDYLMGRNPLNISYVSGYGENAMQNPHHRFWANDEASGWPEVPAGVVAGGPNETAGDPVAIDLRLSSNAPAERYADDIGSWSTNEVTINWNAPLAWVAAFMDEHQNGVVPERVGESTASAMAIDIQETQPAQEPLPPVDEVSAGTDTDRQTIALVVLLAGVFAAVGVIGFLQLRTYS